MKVKYLTDVNINNVVHPAGSVEEMEGRVCETLIARGWAMDAAKVVELPKRPRERQKEEPPEKKVYEKAVKKETEKAVTVEKEPPKKSKKSAFKKVKDDKEDSNPPGN